MKYNNSAAKGGLIGQVAGIRGTLSRFPVLLLAAALFCPVTTTATGNPDATADSAILAPDSLDLARKVLTVSGLEAQIRQIPEAVRDGFDRSVARGEFDDHVPHEFLPMLRQSFAEAFSSTKLESKILEIFQQSLSTQDLAMILSWHNGTLGKKIEAAELEYSHAIAASDREAFLESLANDPLSPSRLRALTDLEKAWQVSKTSVDMMIDMQVAVTTALLSLVPGSEKVPLETIVGHYNASRPDLEKHFESETLFSMSYIYQSLSMEDIKDYTDFAHGELGNRYVKVTNDALHRSMLQGSLELGETMGKLFKNRSGDELVGSGI